MLLNFNTICGLQSSDVFFVRLGPVICVSDSAAEHTCAALWSCLGTNNNIDLSLYHWSLFHSPACISTYKNSTHTGVNRLPYLWAHLTSRGEAIGVGKIQPCPVSTTSFSSMANMCTFVGHFNTVAMAGDWTTNYSSLCAKFSPDIAQESMSIPTLHLCHEAQNNCHYCLGCLWGSEGCRPEVYFHFTRWQHTCAYVICFH